VQPPLEAAPEIYHCRDGKLDALGAFKVPRVTAAGS